MTFERLQTNVNEVYPTCTLRTLQKAGGEQEVKAGNNVSLSSRELPR